jgi:hypothetical protein
MGAATPNPAAGRAGPRATPLTFCSASTPRSQSLTTMWCSSRSSRPGEGREEWEGRGPHRLGGVAEEWPAAAARSSSGCRAAADLSPSGAAAPAAPVASNPTCRCMKEGQGSMASAARFIFSAAPAGPVPGGSSPSVSHADALVTTARRAVTVPPPRSATPAARPEASVSTRSTCALVSTRPPRLVMPLCGKGAPTSSSRQGPLEQPCGWRPRKEKSPSRGPAPCERRHHGLAAADGEVQLAVGGVPLIEHDCVGVGVGVGGLKRVGPQGGSSASSSSSAGASRKQGFSEPHVRLSPLPAPANTHMQPAGLGVGGWGVGGGRAGKGGGFRCAGRRDEAGGASRGSACPASAGAPALAGLRSPHTPLPQSSRLRAAR